MQSKRKDEFWGSNLKHPNLNGLTAAASTMRHATRHPYRRSTETLVFKKQIAPRSTKHNQTPINLTMAPNNQPNIDSKRHPDSTDGGASLCATVGTSQCCPPPGHPRAKDYKKSLVCEVYVGELPDIGAKRN